MLDRSLCFSLFYFYTHTIRIICGKLKKYSKTFSCEKRHKMTFSLVFLLKIGKLHFSDYLRNKAHSPTLNFAFCQLNSHGKCVENHANYPSMQIIRAYFTLHFYQHTSAAQFSPQQNYRVYALFNTFTGQIPGANQHIE